MTRRERLERKVERRREWAEGRDRKASNLRNATPESLRRDWAFITQPGHIPERARMNRRDERAMEHSAMARHHEQKADGLEAQLERTVFSDDEDAIEQLEARIAENEAKRDRMKLINKLYKKGDRTGLEAMGIDLDALKAKLAAAGPYWGDRPHLPYELTNLGARIRSDKQRIEDVKRRQQRAAKADAQGGIAIEYSSDGAYASVTFAEKPDRDILTALKAAGFFWRGGSWHGRGRICPDCGRPAGHEQTRDCIG